MAVAVGAGAAGVFLSPAALALGPIGAVIIRGVANKRNAKVVDKEGGYQVDAVAEKTIDGFKDRVDSDLKSEQDTLSANDVIDHHLQRLTEEKSKNIRRMFAPLMGSAAVTALAYAGFSELNGLINPNQVTSPANPDTNTGQPDTNVGDWRQKIENDQNLNSLLVEANSNGAPEHAVNELFGNYGLQVEGDKTEFLKELASRVGGEDKLFIDADGNAIDMYLGADHADPRYQLWDTLLEFRLTPEALAEARNMTNVHSLTQ